MLSGYEKLTATFTKLSREGTLGQGYLFFGDAGVGKSAFTRALAAFLETGNWEEGERPLVDAVTLAPDEKGSIGIDAIRDLRRFLSQTPLSSPRRTAVITDAEALTDDAQSALLKLVEEPASRVLLLFSTSDPQALFAPLRSRLSRVYVPRLPRASLVAFLMERHGLTESKAARIAAVSFGRVGRALRIMGVIPEASIEGRELEVEIEEAILSLRAEGVGRNRAKLAWLLDREMLVKRFNLNPNLQRKAVREVLAGRV
jgi:DNA polymerase III delta prime subunit